LDKNIFLETHNIKNQATGFGTFNYGLIKGLSAQNLTGLNVTLCAEKTAPLKAEFGSTFSYKKLSGLNRYPMFRVNDKHDLWHSVNQNIKFEPKRVGNYLLTVHDVNFAEHGTDNKMSILFKEKLKRSNAITYISEYAKAQTHQYFDVPNVPEYIIYNGNPVDTAIIPAGFTPDVPVNRPFIFSIGAFIPKKNFTALINMMAHLPGYNLIIAGNNANDYGAEVKQAIENANLQQRVFLTGKISNEAKQYYYAHCAAFALASVAEGFGLPPIEAMTYGKPIFLANRASLPEIGGTDAFYWDDFDAEYMAGEFNKGMDAYSNNPDAFARAYKKRAAGFSWDTAAKQYLDVYHSLL